MALFWRVWLAVSAVNLVVLTLFVVLATLQFDSINSTMTGERLAVLAGRTAAPFAAAARIGLPLSTVRNARALLEVARQTDDQIEAIHVFDATGRIVHSTAEDATVIPPAALAARDAAAGRRWYRETPAGFLSSVNIRRSDGASVGGILIVYPLRSSVTRTRAMAAELGFWAVVVMLAAAALSALLLRLGLSRQIGSFTGVEAAIGGFERDAWRSAAAASIEDSGSADPEDLRQLLDAAEARYRVTGQALVAARQRGDGGEAS